MKLLCNKKYSDETIIELFEFLDLLLSFKSEKLEILFYEEFNKMNKLSRKEVEKILKNESQ